MVEEINVRRSLLQQSIATEVQEAEADWTVQVPHCTFCSVLHGTEWHILLGITCRALCCCAQHCSNLPSDTYMMRASSTYQLQCPCCCSSRLQASTVLMRVIAFSRLCLCQIRLALG